MKYIKNGKVVLDGTIKECDLEEMLLKALEIIVDKQVVIIGIQCSLNVDFYNEHWICPLPHKNYLTKKEFKLLEKVVI